MVGGCGRREELQVPVKAVPAAVFGHIGGGQAQQFSIDALDEKFACVTPDGFWCLYGVRRAMRPGPGVDPRVDDRIGRVGGFRLAEMFSLSACRA
jgi:hypothetical protein